MGPSAQQLKLRPGLGTQIVWTEARQTQKRRNVNSFIYRANYQTYKGGPGTLGERGEMSGWWSPKRCRLNEEEGPQGFQHDGESTR